MVAILSDQESLTLLYNSLVSNQTAKLRIILEPDLKTFYHIINGINITDCNVQYLKLNLLETILELDENLRNEVGAAYENLINTIYKQVQLNDTLKVNNLRTNLKFIKLLNKCVNFAPNVEYPNVLQLNEYLYFLLNEFYDISPEENTTLIKQTISELLFFFTLKNVDKQYVDMLFVTKLNELLLLLVNKYMVHLNFKYSIKLKIPARENNKKIVDFGSDNTSKPMIRYDYSSNKGLDSNLPIPNPVPLKNSLERKILTSIIVIYSSIDYNLIIQNYGSTNNDLINIWKNPHIRLFISSLLKHSDIELKIASLKFLLYPIINDLHVYKNDTQMLNQYLPYLFNVINFKYVPFWFDPFDILISLLDLFNSTNKLNNPITLFLQNSNLHQSLLHLFSKCVSLDKYNENEMVTTIKIIKLWASLSAYDELTRITVISIPNILQQLQNGLQQHFKLLNEFMDFYQEIKNDPQVNLGKIPCLYDSEITISWLKLLKSFSRSVMALRTKLEPTKLTNYLSDLLKVTYSITIHCFNNSNEFLLAELNIMGLTLGNICNFIVEFSSLQGTVLEHGIIETISQILTDPLFNEQIYNESSAIISSDLQDIRIAKFKDLPINDIKTYSLWVLRHLMYNCQNTEKILLLQKISLDTILDFINDPCWSVQEQCFQLIRNLTCNSRRVVNFLLDKFKIPEESDSEDEMENIQADDDNANNNSSNNYHDKTRRSNNHEDIYLFQFLSRKMQLLDVSDTIQRQTLEAILYIVNNITAVNEQKKELIILQDEILYIIKDILSETNNKFIKYGNDYELKLASLWVLNNLLWNSSVSSYTQYVLEGYSATADITVSNDSDKERRKKDNVGKAYLSFNNNNNSSSSSSSGSGIHNNSNRGYSYNENNDKVNEENQDDNGSDDDDSEFIHPYNNGNYDNDNNDSENNNDHNNIINDTNENKMHANYNTVRRCQKLINIGLYEVIKQNIFDDCLDVREKSRTLLYHMDLLKNTMK